MSNTNILDFEQGHTGIDRGRGGIPERIVRIRTVSELCVALFRHLDAAEPLIPITPIIAAVKQELLQELASNQPVTSPPAYFLEIMSGIYWKDAPAHAERAGLDLLMCVGAMSEAMHRDQHYDLPLAQVVLILQDFYRGRGLRFRRSRQRWWLISTSAYEQEFGVRIRVKLPRAPQEDPLDLDG